MRTHSRQPQQDLVKSAGETIEIQCSSDSHEYIYWNYPRESLAIEVKLPCSEHTCYKPLNYNYKNYSPWILCHKPFWNRKASEPLRYAK